MIVSAIKKGIAEVDNLQIDEVLDRIQEFYAKIETGLLKRLAKRNKFADHHLPIFNYGHEEVLEQPPNPNP